MNARGNKCHCLAPATWLIRALSLDANPDRPALKTWACCDEHLAEAARNVQAAIPERGYTLTLRAES